MAVASRRVEYGRPTARNMEVESSRGGLAAGRPQFLITALTTVSINWDLRGSRRVELRPRRLSQVR